MATMKEARGVTWWLFWRYSLVAFIVGIIVGFPAGTLAAIANNLMERPFAPGVLGAWAGGAAGIVASFFVMNFLFTRMFGKKIGNKRIQLIEN
jgi:hypothetical protein